MAELAFALATLLRTIQRRVTASSVRRLGLLYRSWAGQGERAQRSAAGALATLAKVRLPDLPAPPRQKKAKDRASEGDGEEGNDDSESEEELPQRDLATLQSQRRVGYLFSLSFSSPSAQGHMRTLPVQFGTWQALGTTSSRELVGSRRSCIYSRLAQKPRSVIPPPLSTT